MIELALKIQGAYFAIDAAEVKAAINRGLRVAGLNIANQMKQNADGRPGPKVQTGRLRSSIHAVADNAKMEITIGSNVEYAPRIELGFSGTESVKEHYRLQHATRRLTSGKNKGKRVRAQGPDRRIHVNAFTRDANSPAYPFMRPAVEFANRISLVPDAITRELDKAIAASSAKAES